MTLPAFLRSAWYLLRSLTHNLHKFKKHWRCWKIEKKASSFRRPSKVQGIDGQGFAALWQLPLAWHRHDSITKSTGSRRPKNGSNTKHRRPIPWASPGIAKKDKIQALMKSILVDDSDGMVEQVCKEKSWAIKWYGKGSVLNKANSQEPAKCSKMKYIGTTVRHWRWLEPTIVVLRDEWQIHCHNCAAHGTTNMYRECPRKLNAERSFLPYKCKECLLLLKVFSYTRHASARCKINIFKHTAAQTSCSTTYGRFKT